MLLEAIYGSLPLAMFCSSFALLYTKTVKTRLKALSVPKRYPKWKLPLPRTLQTKCSVNAENGNSESARAESVFNISGCGLREITEK